MLIETVPALQANDLIIFNHIPKVGGTSIYYLCLSIFESDQCFRHMRRNPTTNTMSRPIQKLSAQEKVRLRFVMGHFAYGHHRLFKQNTLYIGVVRHPFQRLMSDYYYNRERGRPDLKQRARHLTFEEYALDKLADSKSQMTSNAQIRLLTGKDDLDAAWRVIEDDYLLVCSTPQLNEFQIVLQRYFGIEDEQVIHRNRTRHKAKTAEISDSTRDALLARNMVDLEFYNRIRDRFDEIKQAWL
jgi:hypothetical protein